MRADEMCRNFYVESLCHNATPLNLDVQAGVNTPGKLVVITRTVILVQMPERRGASWPEPFPGDVPVLQKQHRL